MPDSKDEIIADIADHIRRSGGEFSAWRVGTAMDLDSPFFETHQIEEKGDGLIYREAYTPEAARAVRDSFVAQHGAACANGDAGPEGKLVYVNKISPAPYPTN